MKEFSATGNDLADWTEWIKEAKNDIVPYPKARLDITLNLLLSLLSFYLCGTRCKCIQAVAIFHEHQVMAYFLRQKKFLLKDEC